ncbi:S-adenosyl-L-methionine-dependent methyltransferase [Arabidopsis thaliana x Arabidopsis arenosa]|uniref:S-adenosyl-L-methionine-dependent methyltransferase n=1 Tax=Arabidopsis thaliana x Arabidopsis arenosa TaxID=1240361 RepID=A0A8T1XQC3_9BRAS|nr:S-adenosyl-L-methionine-dependent methyltransferase [Arabidopsis thaliana x Arabidopsis arenosa]
MHEDAMQVSQTIYCSHYNNKQQILLVGEGDFSFSLCLARAFGSATNITATSLDTRDELEVKYKYAKNNVEELERLGCTVVHGVNVHSMNTDYRVVRWSLYDRIIFNFPHAGFHCFRREHNISTILKQQEVVRGFLRNAKEMVKNDDGEIHVTHKTTYPFANWGIKTLGTEAGLNCYREMEFDRWQYLEYSNKRGSGIDSDSSFPVGESSTFMFKKVTLAGRLF